MQNCTQPSGRQKGGVTISRRHTLALMFSTAGCMPAHLAAAETNVPIKLAISESMVTDVNINDARAAMSIWIKRMMSELNIVVEMNPRVFDTTEEILRRARSGQLDAVALNVIEYRQIASVLDLSQIISQGGVTGPEQYMLLAKRNNPIRALADLRGSKLLILKAPKMCVAPAWLSTILDEGHFGPSEQFFGSMTTETKASRVILPVFFGQADACLTSKRSFELMCELNPQVGKDLSPIASSPSLVPTFYIFHKNYRSVNREKFVKVYTGAPNSVAGRQIATLFQFESLVVKDIVCLAPALAILDAADHVRAKPSAGSRKG